MFFNSGFFLCSALNPLCSHETKPKTEFECLQTWFPNYGLAYGVIIIIFLNT